MTRTPPIERPTSDALLQHAPVESPRLPAFSAWIDEQLLELEKRYAAFQTRSSVLGSLRR